METSSSSAFDCPPIFPRPPQQPLPFLRYVQAIRQNFVAGFHAAVYEQDIVESKTFGFRNFIVNDPEGIRHVLLDNSDNYPKAKIEHRLLGPGLGNGLIMSDGETWRRHRSIMTPAFKSRSVRDYAGLMIDSSEKLLSNWHALPQGSAVEMSGAMATLTLDIISRSMFSTDSDLILETVRKGNELYQKAMMFGMLDFVPVIGDLWGFFKGKKAKAYLRPFDRSIRRLIEERAHAAHLGFRNDLLDRLILSREQATGIGMSPAEVRDQVFTIFAAGHDTTALALMWTWYLLSQHPSEEAKLHDELERVLKQRSPVYEDIANLPFTRMVVQEAMRLYPPVHSLAWRQALTNDEVCGRRIPKRSIVAIVPWVLHRHRKYWEEPERFNPERFAPGSDGHDRLSYLPFGFGPHVCIGASFAMTEAILIVASIAQRFRVRLLFNHPVEVQALITLKAKYGMKMLIEKR